MSYKLTNPIIIDYRNSSKELFSLCESERVDVNKLTKEINKTAFKIVDKRWAGDKWASYKPAQETSDIMEEELLEEKSADIKVYSEKDPDKIKMFIQNDYNKCKGDLFEIFAEIFFSIYAVNKNFGLDNYKCNYSDDYGVDATGTNPNGHQTVVQHKFRSNPKNLISYGDLAKTVCQGYKKFGYELNQKATLYLFTNTNGANWRAEKQFSDILHVINRNHINEAIKPDNFWTRFNLILNENLPE